ncbi:MAG: AAA family ATPase [Elusimicrobia bacterium]|nr:AAA family ATPase [Elusimicrobiota bacterium]
MYLSYWKLNEKPFENSPDPKFLYYSPQHEEGLARLIYVVREGKGAGLLTGTYGCGKTLLGNALYQELEKDIYRVAFLTNPRLDSVEMLRMIIHFLGGTNIPQRKSDILINLEEILRSNLRDGKKTVIVIDEAHAIEENSVFEEIRLLLNFQMENRFLLTLLILGQPELKNKIDSIKQLTQRIAMRYHLESLNQEETSSYIKHRLKIAGNDGDIFEDETLNLIYERSGGIPRRINQICDIGLLTGMTHQLQKINVNIMKEAIETLER